jgi:low temperature requirement protein LtrA
MIDWQRHVVPMSGRDSDEGHRAATPLELFFDLVIVVAIAVAAGSLHHGIAEGHVFESVLGYSLTFFAIWWAWMGFTWFAAGYDTDDVPYRIAVFVMMAGAIIMAAGIARAFADNDWSVALLGYIVMRLALVSLWLRAARDDPSHRTTNLRFAGSLAVLQLGWIALIVLVPPEYLLVGFAIIAVLELVAPMWAAQATQPRWHPEHIAERYGLLTIIVLGESVLAGTLAIGSAADAGALDLSVIAVAIGALLLVFSMWWLYFEISSDDLLTSSSRAFEWGYGHYFIWAAAAAVGAGIAVAVDVVTHHAHVDLMVGGAAVAVPVAIYLGGVWVLHDVPRPMSRLRMSLTPIAIVMILLTPFTPYPVFLTGVIVVALLAAKIASNPQEPDAVSEAEGGPTEAPWH